MQSSQAPDNFNIPWANEAGVGFVRSIPQASQQGIEPGAASLTDGFPPLNFTPLANGGVPFKGEDVNGIFRWITQWIRWQQAGGVPVYSSAFSTAIGGYPLGAILASADGTHWWRSIVEDNTSDPDTGGANWEVLQAASIPWSSITGAPSFVLTSSFASLLAAAFTSVQSLGPSGHLMLPGGFMVQWGTYTAANSDVANTVSLPVSFPNNHFRAFVSVDWSGTVAGSWSGYATPGSLSTVILTGDVDSGSATNIPLAYLCFGN